MTIHWDFLEFNRGAGNLESSHNTKTSDKSWRTYFVPFFSMKQGTKYVRQDLSKCLYCDLTLVARTCLDFLHCLVEIPFMFRFESPRSSLFLWPLMSKPFEFFVHVVHIHFGQTCYDLDGRGREANHK